VGRENTLRRIPQIPGAVSKTDLNEFYRQLSEQIYAGEGRRGPIEKKDTLNIVASERRTPLRFRGTGNRGSGSISFGGLDNASMFTSKGAYQNDNGAWIAEDTTVVIMEMNRNSTTPIMYRNTGLTIGQVFTPSAVGGVVVGLTPGGGGATVGGGGGGTAPGVALNTADVVLDFGTTDRHERTFDFVPPWTLTPSTRILMTPSAFPATGRDEDELEFDTFSCACRTVLTGTFLSVRAYIHSLRGPVVGPYRFNYSVTL
jgi:hypothetical protein